jgi:hypothetical protein
MFINSFSPRIALPIRLIALSVATALIFLSAPLANADEIFVKIEGIEGESRVDKFEGTIQAVS